MKSQLAAGGGPEAHQGPSKRLDFRDEEEGLKLKAFWSYLHRKALQTVWNCTHLVDNAAQHGMQVLAYISVGVTLKT